MVLYDSYYSRPLYTTRPITTTYYTSPRHYYLGVDAPSRREEYSYSRSVTSSSSSLPRTYSSTYETRYGPGLYNAYYSGGAYRSPYGTTYSHYSYRI